MLNPLARAGVFAGTLGNKLGPVTTMAGTAMTLGVTKAYMPGIIRPFGIAKMAVRQVGLDKPIKRAMDQVSPPAMSYGKRGLDSNRLATSGLVQSLHKGRRNL